MYYTAVQQAGVNSMKHIGVAILLVMLGTSAAFGTERIHLAQAGQTVAPPPSGLLPLNPGNLELPDQLRFIGHELHE